MWCFNAITGDFRSMGVVAQCGQCGLGVEGGGGCLH